MTSTSDPVSVTTSDLPTSTTGAPVVDRVEEFVRHLEAGDILLFDKLTFANRLVQWADNRPVGHCAIWHGDGRVSGGLDPEDDAALRGGEQQRFDLIEAGLGPKTAAGQKGGVLRTTLADLLELTVDDGRSSDVFVVRTVTAMRYRDLQEEQRRAVLRYASEQVSKVEFAKLQLGMLAPEALARSYRARDRLAGRLARRGGEDGDDATELAGVIATSKRYARRWARRRNPAARMFCSELVYRAYEAGDAHIEILSPLYDQRERRRDLDPGSPTGDLISGRLGWSGAVDAEPPPRSGGGAGLSEIDSLLGAYDDFLEEIVDAEDPVGPPDQGGARELSDDDLRLGGFGRQLLRLEFADMVTPGDYWTSPSLDPVVVLHRPPAPR